MNTPWTVGGEEQAPATKRAAPAAATKSGRKRMLTLLITVSGLELHADISHAVIVREAARPGAECEVIAGALPARRRVARELRVVLGGDGERAVVDLDDGRVPD